VAYGDLMRDDSVASTVADAVAMLDPEALPRVVRGFDVAEVRAELLGARVLVQHVASREDGERLARGLEAARFTPANQGYDPAAVRGLLTRAAALVRRVAAAAPDDASAGSDPGVASAVIDSAKAAAAAILRAAQDEAAVLRAHGELARVQAEIDEANDRLRDLLRQTARLRDDARAELEREIEELRRRKLEEFGT
jgi:hypothetical protein